MAEAECHKLPRKKPARGPQYQVKPAASSSARLLPMTACCRCGLRGTDLAATTGGPLDDVASYRARRLDSTAAALAVSRIVAPISFRAVVILQGLLQPDYSHVVMPISALTPVHEKKWETAH